MKNKNLTISLFILLLTNFTQAEPMMQVFKKFGIVKSACQNNVAATNEALANILTSATCAAYSRLLFLKIPADQMLTTKLNHQWHTKEKSNYYETTGKCAIPNSSADFSEYVYEDGAKLQLRLDKQPQSDGEFHFYGKIGRKKIKVVLKNMPNIFDSCQMGQQVQIQEFKIGSGFIDYLTFPYGAAMSLKMDQKMNQQPHLQTNKSLSNTSDYEGVEFILKHFQIQGLSELMAVWSPQGQFRSIKVQFFNHVSYYTDQIDVNNLDSIESQSSHYFETVRFRENQGCSKMSAKKFEQIASLQDCEI